MLEILIIIQVSKKIAAMMKEKGRSAAGFVVIFVFLWIFGELTGAVIGVLIAAQSPNPGHMNDGITWQAIVGALLGAAIGGSVGYAIAAAVPAVEDDRQRYLDTLDDENDGRLQREDADRPRRRSRTNEDDGRFEDSSR